MRKYLALSLALSLSLFAASCGGDGSSVPPSGTLRLENGSDVFIDYFNLPPTYQATWGPDYLNGALASGEIVDFVNIPAGLYDARAIADGLYSVYYAYAFDIPIDAYAISSLTVFSSDFTGSIEIANATVGAYIVELYVSPSSAGTWGPDQISFSVGPGQAVHLTDLPPDTYDVLVVWDTGPDSAYFDNPVDSLALTTLDVS